MLAIQICIENLKTLTQVKVCQQLKCHNLLNIELLLYVVVSRNSNQKRVLPAQNENEGVSWQGH